MRLIIDTLNSVIFSSQFFTDQLLKNVLAIALSFGLCAISIPYIIGLSEKFRWMDQPDNRKMHKQPIPTLGGLGIFIALIPALFMHQMNSALWTVYGLASTLFLIGVLDDLFNLKVWIRLFVEIALATVLFLTDFRIDSLHGIFGIHELSSFTSYLITVFFVVGLTNAINLLDGIDGLAGGIICINALTFGLLFALKSDFTFALLAFTVFGACLGFLKYNFKPAKIFMGDAGSLLIGFLVSVFCLRLYAMPDATSVNFVHMMIMLPVFDTIRLMFSRLIAKKSPFQPDRNHLHHLLLKKGLKHSEASYLLYAFHISMMVMVVLLKDTSITNLLILLAIFNLLFQVYIQFDNTVRLFLLPYEKRTKKKSKKSPLRLNN